MTKVKFILKHSLIIGIIFFILRTLYLGYGDIQQFTLSFSPLPLILSFLLSVVSFVAPTMVWQILLKSQGYKNLDFFKAYSIWFYSFMGRYIPAKVTTIVLRAQLAKEHNISANITSRIAIIEVMFFISAAIFIAMPVQVKNYTGLLLPVIILLLTIVSSIFLLKNATFIDIIGKVIPPLKHLKPISISPGVILKVFFLYIIYWILIGGTLVAFLYSFIHVNIADIYRIVSAYALAHIGGLIAIFAPSGIGVRELALAEMLQPVYGRETAYIISVGARIWSTICEVLIFFMLYVLSRLHRSKEKS